MEAGIFYVFHGKDEFGRSRRLNELRAQAAGDDPSMAELNTSVLEGKNLALGELKHHCQALPFLYDRRLVLVHGLLTWLASRPRRKGSEAGAEGPTVPAQRKKALQELADYLPTLPPTTRLFFVEPESLLSNHPILKLARAEAKKGRAYVEEFPEKKDADLQRWIHEQATKKGGTIESRAADLMVAYVGSDMRLLDGELEKLMLYTEGARAITAEDVELLVSQVREANIFDMVDSIGRRDPGPALELLHRMLDDGKHPLQLLGMITRQFRLLLQVKDLGQRGMPQPAIVKELKLHPYVASKMLQQARIFSLDQLEAAFDRLVEADWAIKTGRATEVLALDLLVVDLTRLGAAEQPAGRTSPA